jgi:hypothetical protein
VINDRNSILTNCEEVEVEGWPGIKNRYIDEARSCLLDFELYERYTLPNNFKPYQDDAGNFCHFTLTPEASALYYKLPNKARWEDIEECGVKEVPSLQKETESKGAICTSCKRDYPYAAESANFKCWWCKNG